MSDRLFRRPRTIKLGRRSYRYLMSTMTLINKARTSGRYLTPWCPVRYCFGMAVWDPQQYLKFADERSRPSLDLVGRINLSSPQRIVDVGCGPGNSTEVLARRWPKAEITGLDSSPDMIACASGRYPQRQWLQSDISNWIAPEPLDLIFSNAALQWVDHHTELLPRMLQMLIPGGAMAIQMPANYYTSPAQTLIRDLASSKQWANKFPKDIRRWHCHEPAFYYDLLCSCTKTLDIWTSEYIHILSGPEAIVEWYKGTGLRPYLDVLPLAECAKFIAAYQGRITQAYPLQPDGRVLFPFRRLFIIAYK